jgi:hypothetical protein
VGGSFSYGYGTNPIIDPVRLLVSDTVEFDPEGNQVWVFADQEIQMAYNIQAQLFQSAQFYSPPSAAFTLPSQPVSQLRVAALLLDALAANTSRLATIKQVLDVRLDSADAAIQLRATAAEYRQVEDESGAFAIIEQVNDAFSFRDRWWKQVQRTTGGIL